MANVIEDHECKLSIDSDGDTDTYSWYQIWALAVALNGVCVRSGRSGMQSGIGVFCDWLGLGLVDECLRFVGQRQRLHVTMTETEA